MDDQHRRRLNWDRLVLVAFVLLQATLVIVLLIAVVALAVR